MNVAAWLIFILHRTDHISDALINLHWLRAQERVLFKMAVLTYKASHGATPLYLSQLVRVADLPGRCCLCSAWTNLLLVLSVKLSTVGGRAFPVARPTLWNSLLGSISFYFLSVSENISLPGLVSWHCHRSPLNYSPTFSGS